MPRNPLAGLEKQVVELPFVDGLANDFSEHFRPTPEASLLVLENVDMTETGKMRNRVGFEALKNRRLGSDVGASSIAGTQMRLFQREDELGVIANTQVSMGSGAGWGGAGDTVFTYAPDIADPTSGAGVWKAHGKIGRPTLTNAGNMTPDTNVRICDTCVAGNFMLVAWHTLVTNNTGADTWGDLMYRVIDLTTNTTVIESSIFPVNGTHVNARTAPPVSGGVDRGLQYQAKMQCVAAGTRLYVFWLAADDALALPASDLLGFYVDVSASSPVPSAASLLAVGVSTYSATTDGASLFVAYVQTANPTNIVISKRNSDLSFSVANTLVVPRDVLDVQIAAGSGVVPVIYTQANPGFTDLLGAAVYLASTLVLYSTANHQLEGAGTSITARYRRPDVLVLTSNTYAWAYYIDDEQVSGLPWGPATGPQGVVWGTMANSAGAVVNTTVTGTGFGAFVAPGICNVARMFTINGRVFMPVVKTDWFPSSGFNVDAGYFLVELDVSPSQNATDLYRMPMIAANWATDLSSPVLDTNTIAPYQAFTGAIFIGLSDDYVRSDIIGSVPATLRGESFGALHVRVKVTIAGIPGVWEGTYQVNGGPAIPFTSVASGAIVGLVGPQTYGDLYLEIGGLSAVLADEVVWEVDSRVEISLPSGSVYGNKYYLANRTGSALGISPTPLFSAYRLDVAVLDFADPYRWRSRPFGSLVDFGGATMFACDGRRVFESSIETRPRIVFIQDTGNDVLAAVDPLQAGTLYYFRAVYTWLDAAGNRYFSAPSYASRTGDSYQHVVKAGSTPPFVQSIRIYVTLPQCFSGMVNGADYFKNSMEVWLYCTKAAVPDIYYLVAQLKGDQGSEYSYDFFARTPIGTLTLDHEPAATNDQIYVSGGELENSASPPARIIEAHRDRLFALSEYDNNVYYTKPRVAGRAIEWCMQTQVIALPEKGSGLASNETCLMIFTTRGVYAVEGYGPSATGQPANAFGTLQLISNQLGLYEVNSCKTTPVGVIFRTNQGWWLVDRSLTLSYIGMPVGKMMSQTARTIAICVDPQYGCVRIVTANGGFGSYGFTAYTYWYDSKRWSTDTYRGAFAIFQDAMVAGDDYYMLDGENTLKRSESTWLDGPLDVSGHSPKVSTGWITLANMAMYKRIWRVIATVENLTGGAELNPGVRLRIWADWNDVAPIIDKIWTSDEIETGIRTIRAHLPIQKMKAIKVEASQTTTEEATGATGDYNDNPGYNFIGLGFEIGLKNRTSPEKAGRST